MGTGRLAMVAAPTAIVGLLAYIITSSISEGLKQHIEEKKEDKEVVEEEFKQKFLAHVTKKQQLIIDLTSDNCSNQVEQ